MNSTWGLGCCWSPNRRLRQRTSLTGHPFIVIVESSISVRQSWKATSFSRKYLTLPDMFHLYRVKSAQKWSIPVIVELGQPNPLLPPSTEFKSAYADFWWWISFQHTTPFPQTPDRKIIVNISLFPTIMKWRATFSVPSVHAIETEANYPHLLHIQLVRLAFHSDRFKSLWLSNSFSKWCYLDH